MLRENNQNNSIKMCFFLNYEWHLSMYLLPWNPIRRGQVMRPASYRNVSTLATLQIVMSELWEHLDQFEAAGTDFISKFVTKLPSFIKYQELLRSQQNIRACFYFMHLLHYMFRPWSVAIFRWYHKIHYI
jgi:hypothetical protein